MKFYGLICLFFIVVLANQTDVSTAVSPVDIVDIKEKGNKQQFELVVMVELNEALSLIELEETAAKLARNKVLQHIGQEVTHKTTIINDQLVKDAITGYRHVISKIDRTHRSISEQVIRYEFSVFIDKERMGREYDLSLRDRVEIVNINNSLKEKIKKLERLNSNLIKSSGVINQLELKPPVAKEITHNYQVPETANLVDLLNETLAVSFHSKNKAKKTIIIKGPTSEEFIESIGNTFSKRKDSLVPRRPISFREDQKEIDGIYFFNNGVRRGHISHITSNVGLLDVFINTRKIFYYNHPKDISNIAALAIKNKYGEFIQEKNKIDNIYIRTCNKKNNHGIVSGCKLARVARVLSCPKGCTGFSEYKHDSITEIMFRLNPEIFSDNFKVSLKADVDLFSVGIVTCPSSYDRDSINEESCKLEMSSNYEFSSTLL